MHRRGGGWNGEGGEEKEDEEEKEEHSNKPANMFGFIKLNYWSLGLN